MTTNFPSIQSFYSKKISSERGVSDASESTKTGDGFTPSEVEAAVNPLSRPFRPSRSYVVCPIAELQTGHHNYVITGRLVNFSSTGRPHSTPPNAGGYYFLLLSDGAAAISVSSSNHTDLSTLTCDWSYFWIKLYCSPSEPQPLTLGQRVTVWVTSILLETRPR
jgi:hypothetical protein